MEEQMQAGVEAGETTEPVAAGAEANEETVTEVYEAIDANDFAEDRPSQGGDRAELKALLEAVIYVTDEPLTLAQIAAAVSQPAETVREVLDELVAEYSRPDRGLSVREVAGGFKMATKPEHHEAIRAFVKNLKPALKLSLAALETLAVIAYKQPVTGPEIMDIRGVQGLGVLKTLIDRRLVATAGRKNVVGKPILYKTTKEFLVQFGLKDLAELPTLKEFEELGRLAFNDTEPAMVANEEVQPMTETAVQEDKVEAAPTHPDSDPVPVEDPEEDDEPPMDEPPADPDDPHPPMKVAAADSNG